MSKSPAFQFYVNDWLSSPKIMLMTPAEEGAYIRLLCYAWSDPDCSLPDDDEELSALSRLGEGWFKGGSSKVRKCFEPHPEIPGRLVNQRLLEEREKQEEWREKSRAGGIKSGESRRSKPTKRTKPPLKGGSQMVEPNTNSSSSSSNKRSSITSVIEETSRAKPRSVRRTTACDEEFLTELQQNPAYQALDVQRCYAKMCVWCENKGKQPTRGRFINWLNREDQPMGATNGKPKTNTGKIEDTPIKLGRELKLTKS